MELAVSVPSVPDVAGDWAVDGLTWAREKLVDYLILHAGGVTSLEDLRFHVEALEGVGVPVVIDFYPRAACRLGRGCCAPWSTTRPGRTASASGR